MIRQTPALACFALVLAVAGGAEAQCPPGQPCVVVVPATPPPAAVPAPPPAAYGAPVAPGGYVQPTYAQPAYAQPGYAQPAYGAPQPIVTTRTRLRMGLVGPGIGLLVGGWVANWATGLVGWIALATSSGSTWDQVGDYFGWSWVPILGPWVDAGYFAGDATRDGWLGIHILWGVLQAGGLLMCILGTVFPEEVEEVTYAFGRDGPQLAVTPWADPNGGGLSVGLVGF